MDLDRDAIARLVSYGLILVEVTEDEYHRMMQQQRVFRAGAVSCLVVAMKGGSPETHGTVVSLLTNGPPADDDEDEDGEDEFLDIEDEGEGDDEDDAAPVVEDDNYFSGLEDWAMEPSGAGVDVPEPAPSVRAPTPERSMVERPRRTAMLPIWVTNGRAARSGKMKLARLKNPPRWMTAGLVRRSPRS